MSIEDTMNLTPEQRDWFHGTFAKWHEVMRPYDGLAAGGLIRRVPTVPKEHFAGCKVVFHREDILHPC